MKISTKGRYALRLMLDIALHDTDEPVRVKDIAKRQDISVKYLEQIISVLVRAEYLRSIRGPQGGYRLTKKPEDYKAAWRRWTASWARTTTAPGHQSA